jgi:hypothetical protein
MTRHGPVEQLGCARRPVKAEVAGSNPVGTAQHHRSSACAVPSPPRALLSGMSDSGSRRAATASTTSRRASDPLAVDTGIGPAGSSRPAGGCAIRGRHPSPLLVGPRVTICVTILRSGRPGQAPPAAAWGLTTWRISAWGRSSSPSTAVIRSASRWAPVGAVQAAVGAPGVAVAPEADLEGVGDRPSRAPDHNAPPGHTLLDDLQTLVATKVATRSRSLGSAPWRWASSSRVRYWRSPAGVSSRARTVASRPFRSRPRMVTVTVSCWSGSFSSMRAAPAGRRGVLPCT